MSSNCVHIDKDLYNELKKHHNHNLRIVGFGNMYQYPSIHPISDFEPALTEGVSLECVECGALISSVNVKISDNRELWKKTSQSL